MDVRTIIKLLFYTRHSSRRVVLIGSIDNVDQRYIVLNHPSDMSIVSLFELVKREHFTST